jgi:hypothetical protein
MDAPKVYIELERSNTDDREADAVGLNHGHPDDASMSVDDGDAGSVERGATATATAAASTALPPMETFFFSHFGEIRQGEDAESIDAAIAALDDKVGGVAYTRCTSYTRSLMWIIPSSYPPSSFNM